MAQITIRPATPEDAKSVLSWSLAEQDSNHFDPDVVTYPNSFTFCAEDDSGPLMYLPVHTPLFLESLAMRPGASPRNRVSAGLALLDAAIAQAEQRGCGEAFVLATEETVARVAEKRGFQRMTWVPYRLKLKDR